MNVRLDSNKGNLREQIRRKRGWVGINSLAGKKVLEGRMQN